MTYSFATRSHADDIIHDAYRGLVNKGLIESFIQPDTHTSDFELPDGLKVRAKQEKDIVYYCIFRVK